MVSVTPALQAQGLTLRLGGRVVVDGVTLALHAGQWTALVGPNGAGKSTLLQALAGVSRPAAGSVALQGRALTHGRRANARSAGWLAQHGEADGDLAARDVVRLGRMPHHAAGRARTRR